MRRACLKLIDLKIEVLVFESVYLSGSVVCSAEDVLLRFEPQRLEAIAFRDQAVAQVK